MRVHESGRPFTDPSGDRLRDWMGVDEETFYDRSSGGDPADGLLLSGLRREGLRPAAAADLRADMADAGAWSTLGQVR
jgi:uracil-DNA glycosylase